MRLISLENVREDMILGKSLYRGNGELLLSQGTKLTPQFIKRLKELGYHSVYIYNELLSDIDFDDAVSEKTRLQAIECIGELTDKVRKGRTAELEPVKNVVSNIVEELLSSRDIMLNVSNILNFDEYTFDHSVNVTVISVVIGMTLYYSKDKLVDLGMGVILHDVGKTLVPTEILRKPGKLTEEEYEIIKQHTWHGFELLRVNPQIKITSSHVALQHHERYNGSGYPRGLKGKKIIEFARISAVADVFDAMTNDRCYRSKFPVHKVYEYLLENSGVGFDPIIVENFVQKIALFPKGTKVMLNDGRSGFVIKQNHLSPLRPVVRVFWDKGRGLTKPVEVDLLQNEFLSISSVIED